MSLIEIRKRSLTVETIYHEGGPPPATPLRTGRRLRGHPQSLCRALRARPVALHGRTAHLWARCWPRSWSDASAASDKVEAYSKAAIVGVNGELEHGAVWHEAGGWAMRQVLGEPKAIVPAAKAVAALAIG